jgi:prevent-host-death family protein
MKTVMNVAEAKAKLSELIERAERGEEVLIARKGKVAAKLVAANDGAPVGPKLGAWAHLDIELSDDLWAADPMDALYCEQTIEEDCANPDPIPAKFIAMKARGEI